MKVTLENVTKKFPSRTKNSPDVIAVNKFDFEFPDGKLIALLGPSGFGKSTTLNLISGLLKATEGKVFFGDDDVTELAAEKRGVGLVFQNYALYPHLTVRQNILFPLQNLRGKDKMSKTEMNSKAEEIARLVQVDKLMERKHNELSGGQQQRVAISRALVKMTKVLLLDEPLSNLDARLRLQTREEIRRIQKETRITTVFVTHDQDEAMSISDMIVVMRDGVVHQTGLPQEVYDNPDNLFVAQFLGTPPISVFDGTVKDGSLYIGNDKVLDGVYADNADVTVGIRPEGYILKEDGALCCKLRTVEVMGRDISVVSSNDFAKSADIRSIISSENKVDTSKEYVRFNLRREKVFLFDKENGKRIRFCSEKGGIENNG
ncbi:MAG: ABC transporter ATP-binding protein [Clostridia bacterium]|nr:ABC transporter ATP-binding protein [Clostridia bacterium]